jgi:hypothetical protein
MGYIQHNAIIVTSFAIEYLERARAIALAIFGEGDVSNIVPNLESGRLNGYCSFFIPPDGSKEGWGESNDGDKRRDEFFELIKRDNSLYVDVVEVEYGEGGAAIVRAGDTQ